jgi:hypothetical protein
LLACPHPRVQHTGFHLQESDVHDTGTVGHVWTIRLDGCDRRDEFLITRCVGSRYLRGRGNHVDGTDRRRAPDRESYREEKKNGPTQRPPTIDPQSTSGIVAGRTARVNRETVSRMAITVPTYPPNDEGS